MPVILFVISDVLVCFFIFIPLCAKNQAIKADFVNNFFKNTLNNQLMGKKEKLIKVLHPYEEKRK